MAKVQRITVKTKAFSHAGRTPIRSWYFRQGLRFKLYLDRFQVGFRTKCCIAEFLTLNPVMRSTTSSQVLGRAARRQMLRKVNYLDTAKIKK